MNVLKKNAILSVATLGTAAVLFLLLMNAGNNETLIRALLLGLAGLTTVYILLSVFIHKTGVPVTEKGRARIVRKFVKKVDGVVLTDEECDDIAKASMVCGMWKDVIQSMMRNYDDAADFILNSRHRDVAMYIVCFSDVRIAASDKIQKEIIDREFDLLCEALNEKCYDSVGSAINFCNGEPYFAHFDTNLFSLFRERMGKKLLLHDLGQKRRSEMESLMEKYGSREEPSKEKKADPHHGTDHMVPAD